MWEVVYPTSRAVELDEEDDEDYKHDFDSHLAAPVVRLSRCSTHKSANEKHNSTNACKLLVFAFGPIATTFIEAHFFDLDTQIVGLVSGAKKEKDFNSLLQTTRSDKTCFIHLSNIAEKEASPNEVLFCQSKVECPAAGCHNWAKEVFSSIKADKVLVLSTLPASQCSLNEFSESESEHVFSLKTNTWKTTVEFSFLRSPNIVSGLPAAVLTHCQIFNIPAVMYVGVTETNGVDSSVVGMFNALLDQDPLKDIPQRSKSEVLKYMKSVNVVSPHLRSNLYT